MAAAGVAGMVFPRLSTAQPIAIGFEPGGLKVRHKGYRYTISWDKMTVWVWSVNNVEFISIDAASPARVALSAVAESPQDQPRIVAKLEQRFRRTQQNNGGILTINPMRFDVNPLHLAEALQRCIEDPQARDQMRPLVEATQSQR